MVQVQKTVEIYGPDHRDFTVAVHLKGGRCPAGAVHRVPHFMAMAVEKGFSPVLWAFFALRPLGRRVPALPRLFF